MMDTGDVAKSTTSCTVPKCFSPNILAIFERSPETNHARKKVAAQKRQYLRDRLTSDGLVEWSLKHHRSMWERRNWDQLRNLINGTDQTPRLWPEHVKQHLVTLRDTELCKSESFVRLCQGTSFVGSDFHMLTISCQILLTAASLVRASQGPTVTSARVSYCCHRSSIDDGKQKQRRAAFMLSVTRHQTMSGVRGPHAPILRSATNLSGSVTHEQVLRNHIQGIEPN